MMKRINVESTLAFVHEERQHEKLALAKDIRAVA